MSADQIIQTSSSPISRLNLLKSNKILTLIHKDTTVAGLVGEKLVTMGYQLEMCAPFAGEALPEDLARYAAVLVFGGPMSVNDNELYLRQELNWLEQVLAAKVPYLGICLGAQLLAKVLGAKVGPHAIALEEIGYYSVYATAAGKGLFPDQMRVYHWHKEGFDLPKGAVLLARGDDFPNQAFQWGERTYGVQFHPEMTAKMMDFWTTQGAHLIGAPNTQCREQQLKNHRQYSAEVDKWLETFLTKWLT